MSTENKWEYLEDEFEDLPRKEKIQRSMTPEGSITNFRRGVEPRMNRTKKRVREAIRRMKETHESAGTQTWE